MRTPPVPEAVDRRRSMPTSRARRSGSDGRKLVKLSANENPLGSSPRAHRGAAAAAAPWLYPDPDSVELRRRWARCTAIDPARIVCGTGSGELLDLAAQAYAGPGDEVVYVRYGFSLYEIAARRCGATPVVAADSDYGTDVDEAARIASASGRGWCSSPIRTTRPAAICRERSSRACMPPCRPMCCW